MAQNSNDYGNAIALIKQSLKHIHDSSEAGTSDSLDFEVAVPHVFIVLGASVSMHYLTTSNRLIKY